MTGLEAATAATARRRPVGEGHGHSEGHGHRLTRALEALEVFPALVESRDRLLRVVRESLPSTAGMVAAVESDPALAISVLRLANRKRGPDSGKVASIRRAIEILGPVRVEALAARVDVFSFFEGTRIWGTAPEHFRVHAVAVQRAADRVAREINLANRGEVSSAALLHDIGKLVLLQAYPGYPDQIHGDAQQPEACLRAERRELGVDHALVGGVLTRRWQLPERLARTIERHHSDEDRVEHAVVRLADMLAHYLTGRSVDASQLMRTARAVGLDPQALRSIIYELPFGSTTVGCDVEPCPLTGRELETLKRLAEGKVYTQIAVELGLSTSTVRTHLHNSYAKLGVADRAQAVLMASDRGWL